MADCFELLLVDSTEDTGKFLCEVLPPAFCRVKIERTVSEALQALETLNPNLMIFAYHQDVDSSEDLSLLYQLGQLRKVPVIAFPLHTAGSESRRGTAGPLCRVRTLTDLVMMIRGFLPQAAVFGKPRLVLGGRKEDSARSVIWESKSE